MSSTGVKLTPLKFAMFRGIDFTLSCNTAIWTKRQDNYFSVHLIP